MRAPHELMSKTYCGPSKLIPLAKIKNEDGFRFIGIGFLLLAKNLLLFSCGFTFTEFLCY